ncbi:hypothetical protein ACKLNR_006308 [Fusarium oxysporum f. sp. zingiberi]
MASQQTSNDVRDRYDITNDHQGQTTSNILKLQPPTDCEHTTGLDALIVVLRRIYTATMFGPHGLAQVDRVKAAEEENPTLEHAWHVMGDSKEERLAANKARADLIATLGTEMNAGVASFKRLVYLASYEQDLLVTGPSFFVLAYSLSPVRESGSSMPRRQGNHKPHPSEPRAQS